jgi:hypothetical protein
MNVGIARSAVLAPACMVAMAATLAGCFVEDHHGYGYDYGPGYTPAPVMTLPVCPKGTETAPTETIDTGASLVSPPGEGTGVFVEYQAAGHWHVWVSCDTALTGQGCAYDATAQVFDGVVSNVRGEQLEPPDIAGSQCADTAYLSVSTGSDLDGLLFDAPAGATVRVTATLGGARYPNLLYWVGGGDARNDANADPVDFKPSAP